jgi:hypothetical protein
MPAALRRQTGDNRNAIYEHCILPAAIKPGGSQQHITESPAT